jgi:NAD(P)-dependent dehydrogenase (short-subunit alcohol dehydrogenase family)
MDNKIAVITGARRGLGRSMALHLARQGVGIVGTFKNESDDGFKSTAAEVGSSPVKVLEHLAKVGVEGSNPFARSSFFS